MRYGDLYSIPLSMKRQLASHDNASLPKLAYNRQEAAEILGISPPTLDRLTARGLLNPSRATRRPLYALEELQRFLQETKGRLEVSKA